MHVNRAVLSLLFVLGLTAVVFGMIYVSFGYSQSARTAPLVIGLPTGVFLVVQLIRDIRAMAKGDRVGGVASEQEADRYAAEAAGVDPDDIPKVAISGDMGGTAIDSTTSAPSATTSPVGSTLWVFALVVAIWVFGMLIAIPVYTIAFMRGFGGERWRTAILFAIGTVIVVYMFFIVVLEISLYEGLLGGYLPFV
jgi:hypothetical protein